MLPDGSVVLDVQGAQNRQHRDRGIARYTVEQVAGVLDHAPRAVRAVTINPDLTLPGRLDFLFGRDLLQPIGPNRPLTGEAPQIFHITSPIELDLSIDQLWPRWARTPATQLVVTLYDLIPLVFEDYYLREPLARARYLARLNLVRAADRVLAISRTTADDAIERLELDPDRVSVIDAGVSEHFTRGYDAPGAARAVLQQRLPELREAFLLYVGGIEYRKNIDRLVDGYARMPAGARRRHQLVIACRMSPEDRDRLQRHGRDLGLEANELVLPGYVTDDELTALYHRCVLFVFPSLYEGSGLPILEAMACGAPVAASNTSTSPEILGDTEATFDPHDADDIARVMSRVVDDAELLERLRERSRSRAERYTWSRVAMRTIEGYEAALGSLSSAAGRRRRRRRPHIAWVSPWPPEQSGVATYSGRLVQELRERVDVDVFVDRPMDEYPPPPRGIRLGPMAALPFAADTWSYDRVIYSMGNSSFHHGMYRALRRVPGTVIAHDVRLVGFYRSLAEVDSPEDPWPHLAHLIRLQYGDRVDAMEFVRRPPSPAEQEDLGLFMTHELQQWADRFIVHSRYAADILRLDRPADLVGDRPVDVVPHALLPRKASAARKPELIASFGVLSEIKGLATLIDAFALLAARRPNARLVLAGPAYPDEQQRWRDHAAAAGVGDHTDVQGFVSDAAYEDLLGTAAIAVQLRQTSNGEASGAITDCLAAGVPTIVTDHAWTAELPGETVERVDRRITPTALAAVLDALLDDDPRRHTLSSRARAYAAETTYADVARRYLEVLELD